VFRVTHPFHPRLGEELELVVWKQTWGEDRVYFHDELGRLCSMPARWTDILPQDPFVVVSAGRSCLRVAELIELANLVERLRS